MLLPNSSIQSGRLNKELNLHIACTDTLRTKKPDGRLMVGTPRAGTFPSQPKGDTQPDRLSNPSKHTYGSHENEGFSTARASSGANLKLIDQLYSKYREMRVISEEKTKQLEGEIGKLKHGLNGSKVSGNTSLALKEGDTLNKPENHRYSKLDTDSAETKCAVKREDEKKVAEFARLLKEKDGCIAELRKDIADIKKAYDFKLQVANNEIAMMKDNLCAVKKVKAADSRTAEGMRKNYASLQLEIDRLRRINKSLLGMRGWIDEWGGQWRRMKSTRGYVWVETKVLRASIIDTYSLG